MDSTSLKMVDIKIHVDHIQKVVKNEQHFFLQHTDRTMLIVVFLIL